MKKLFPLFLLSFVALYSSGCISGPGTMPPPNYLDPKYKTAFQKLPETTALEKELRQIHKLIVATSERVKKQK